jgi:hypothetical protein
MLRVEFGVIFVNTADEAGCAIDHFINEMVSTAIDKSSVLVS